MEASDPTLAARFGGRCQWRSGSGSPASGRWELESREAGPHADRAIDPWRPAVIPRCPDQIARAVERITDTARDINLRNTGREQRDRKRPVGGRVAKLGGPRRRIDRGGCPLGRCSASTVEYAGRCDLRTEHHDKKSLRWSGPKHDAELGLAADPGAVERYSC